MESAAKAAGTAPVQGKLWGARANDWAEVQEPLCEALFEAVLAECRVGRDKSLLDVGCGSGRALQMARERGAKVAGIDASPQLIEVAKRRVPDGEWRSGEMQELPFDDRTFDLVTGFNSFQYAASPVAALAEAKRVSRNGNIAIAVWGPRDRCQAAPYLAALGSLLPPPPPGAPGPFALSEGEALQSLLRDAGLHTKTIRDVVCTWIYRDANSAARGLLSAGPAARAIDAAGEPRVRDAVLRSIEPYRRSDGSYRLDNVFRFAIAEA
jgi:SAM-dependent methyltransferase